MEQTLEQKLEAEIYRELYIGEKLKDYAGFRNGLRHALVIVRAHQDETQAITEKLADDIEKAFKKWENGDIHIPYAQVAFEAAWEAAIAAMGDASTCKDEGHKANASVHTSSPAKRHIGDFDAYVQDESEAEARLAHNFYMEGMLATGQYHNALSFEDWVANNTTEPTLDLIPFYETLKPKLRPVPTNPETRDMVDAISAKLGDTA